MASDQSQDAHLANPQPTPIDSTLLLSGNKRQRSPSLDSDEEKQSLCKETGMEGKRPDEIKQKMKKIAPTSPQAGEQEEKKEEDENQEEEKEKVVKSLPATNHAKEVTGNNEVIDSTDGVPESFLVESLVKLVMTNGPPLHTLETGMYPSVKSLSPNVGLPSVSELKNDLVRIHQQEKSRLKKILKKHRVCLSTETWVDKDERCYMSIRAHWINEKWELCSKVLSFHWIPPILKRAHSFGEELGKIWEQCLKEWCIESVLTVTVGKTYTEDGAVEYLKSRTKDKIGTVLGHEFLHMRSYAHVISEVVKEGLEAEKETIHKIWSTVSFVGTSGRYEHFKECARKENLEHQGRLFVNKERMWDSVYMMLHRATNLQKAFERLMKEDSLYLSCFYPPEEGDNFSGNKTEKSVLTELPAEADWKSARHLAKILRLLYKAMRRLSNPLCTTSSFFLEEVSGMQIRLSQLSRDDDSVLGALAVRMKKKFDEYWGDLFGLNPLFYVAQVLDPRKKLKFIRFYLNEIGFESSVVESFIERAEANLVRLFQQYLEFEPEKSLSGSILGPVNTIDDEPFSQRLMVKFTKITEYERKMDRLLELKVYVNAGCETCDGSFDILNWWKTNCTVYPVLSKIARDVLAIPATSSFYEHAFSKDLRELVWHKSILSDELRETLICAQDWFMFKPPPADFKEAVIDEMAIEDEEELQDDF